MISPRIRGIAMLVAALFLGVAAGMAIERSRASRVIPPAMDPEMMMRTFDRELGLDPRQHREIEQVLQRHQAVIDSAWHSLRPTVRAAIDSSQMEIVRVLRADQQQKFMTLLKTAHPAM